MAKRETISLKGKTKKEKEDIQLLQTFKDNIDDWYTYYAENNDNFKADKVATYAKNGLWTDAEVKQYKDEGRPMMTFNMLPKFVTNVISLFSTRGADLEVRPKNTAKGAPQQNIDIYTNILRDISFSSRNNIVYRTALENAVSGGYGAFLVNVEKETQLSFKHVVRYKAIQNPLTCGWDPIAREIDKSDGNFCFMGNEISKKDFEARYPDEPVPESNISSEKYVHWVTKKDVVLMDMWIKEPIRIPMTMLSNGMEVETEKVDELMKQNRQLLKASPAEDKLTIEKEEVMVGHKIKFYRFSRDKIYEKKEWLGTRLPIPFAPGIIRWVDGKECTFSLVRWQKDAQRAYNYARNEYLYRMMLNTYFKIMATAENIGDYKEVWENPTQAKGPLLYNPGPNGEMPQVLPNQGVGDDLQKEMSRSLEDLQLISGRVDQNFGEQGNETSGIAGDNRRNSGNANVKEFFDNIEIVVESGAINSMDLIPKVYDSERDVAVTLPNGKGDVQTVNSNDPNNVLEQIEFTVEVSVGPNLDIQQQKEADILLKLVQSNPELHEFVDDIIVKNLDIQSSPQIVERIRRYKIPQIAAQEGSKDPVVVQQAHQQQKDSQHKQQQAQQVIMLKIKGILQQMQIAGHKSKDDTMKAQASMMTSTANMMNAQTERGEAVNKGMHETEKLRVEEDKSQNELQIQMLKLFKELEEVGNPAGISMGNINPAPEGVEQQ